MERNLYHHGILGQKWGVRRFQNNDGTLTSAGRKRYRNDLEDNSGKQKNTFKGKRKSSMNAKKALNIGAAAVGTALAVCGTYKLAKSGNFGGLVQIGKNAMPNLQFVGGGNRYGAVRRGFGSDYERWSKANDIRIRNHSRL